MVRLLALFAAFLAVGGGVEGHGYLKSPKSRNYEAWETGNEYCAHCLNLGGELAQCGLVGNRNYDLVQTGPQWTYSRGDIVEFDIVLTAHHKGHFEFNACPIQPGEIPSGDCFEQYPLEFVSDELYGAPKDNNHPTRAYIAPIDYPGLVGASSTAGLTGSFYRFRLKLPDTLVGDLVLLQWHYLTANSCVFEGYDTYPFPGDWNLGPGGLGVCANIPADGIGVPEQFWNCAEVSVVDGPTPAATSAPSPSPGNHVPGYNSPGSYPGAGNGGGGGTSPLPDGKCGNGFVQDATCLNPNDCCSKMGWCGSGSAHCDDPATAQPISGPTDAPAPTPTDAPDTPVPVVVPTDAPDTPAPVVEPTTAPGTPAPVDSSQWTISTVSHRCGRGSNPELDARGNCRTPCTHPIHCGAGEFCVGVQMNYCGSKPVTQCDNLDSPSTTNRCGTSELDARETCGMPCVGYSDCDAGQWCFGVHPNLCDCGNRRMLRGREDS